MCMHAACHVLSILSRTCALHTIRVERRAGTHRGRRRVGEEREVEVGEVVAEAEEDGTKKCGSAMPA